MNADFLLQGKQNLPNTVQDEEQLNKDTSERKDTSHQNTRQWSGVDALKIKEIA